MALTNRQICDDVRALVPNALSSDRIRCSHTYWSQKEGEYAVRRGLHQLQDEQTIVLDKKTHLY